MRTNPGGRGAGEGDTLIDDLRKSVRPPAVVFAFEAVPALDSEISTFSNTRVVFLRECFKSGLGKFVREPREYCQKFNQIRSVDVEQR